MTRLTDKDAIYMELVKMKDFGELTAKKAIRVVEKAPTIDAEPVRHGKWLEYPIADGMNQCSVCGVLRFGESNYCPNCGARMDEDE